MRHSKSANKKRPLDTVMCFVKISTINTNARIDNTSKRMIGSEYNSGLTCCPCSIHEQSKFVSLGATSVVSFTTVAVINVDRLAVNLLHKLFAKLVGEENTRSDNYDSLSTTLEGTNGILNHNHCLTSASGYNNLTHIVALECIKGTNLVRAKSDSQVLLVSDEHNIKDA